MTILRHTVALLKRSQLRTMSRSKTFNRLKPYTPTDSLAELHEDQEKFL